MMGTMSPKNPGMEQEGMNEARDFFGARLEMSSGMVRFFGDQVFQKRQAQRDALLNAKGVGFRRMAYIISKQRKRK
jgi:hypothetical protein